MPLFALTVLNTQEAMLIISNLSGKYQIIASLLFGAGLRINEALRLRIKDIDFHMLLVLNLVMLAARLIWHTEVFKILIENQVSTLSLRVDAQPKAN
ncbi:hypothetical protein [Gayadomonas joobiniege]|uniref:hypothetical protein n=1 Tax=Gayadomonas joobiniege TaxID=1234606 RepID=UPI003B436B62